MNNTINKEKVLDLAIAAIKKYGYANYENAGNDCTSMRVKRADDSELINLSQTVEIRNIRNELINFFKNEDSSDWYFLRIKSALQNDYITKEDIGIVSYAYQFYASYLERKAKRDALKAEKEKVLEVERQTSNYIGNVGDRITIKNAAVNYVKRIESQFGTCYLYKIVDELKNIYIWFSSNGNCEDSDSSYVTGTIKAHKEFDGVKQTVLTRCKIERKG